MNVFEPIKLEEAYVSGVGPDVTSEEIAGSSKFFMFIVLTHSFLNKMLQSSSK
jgi:hypothetical protein